ncbi:MAG: class I SAM-dependent methyltransferase [Chloroflexi bacterium]|nr:class I SAM-dependent methyltransferase [Chloroflexota bacterium]
MPELPPPTQHDAAYLDYLEGLKRHNYSRLVKAVVQNYQANVTCLEEERGYRPTTLEEAGALIKDDLVYQFACGLQRNSHLMLWRAGLDSLAPHREKILAIMAERMPTNPLGQLELNPNIKWPRWYTEFDIHLNPGGYWGNELVGAVYQRCVGVHRLGWRHKADPGPIMTFARSASKRNYRRILDMGCAMGGSTIAFRRAYPDAEEVVGIDYSANALKWAHLTAEELGLKITFAQRDAVDTDYPDESFDLVTSFLLPHEQPREVVEATIREAYRLLRPGGHLTFLEHAPYHVLPPEEQFITEYDTYGNGDPFMGPFLSMDFVGLLRKVGFVNAEEAPLDYPDPHYWGSHGLMRTGEFKPHNRWVTRGDKPPYI